MEISIQDVQHIADLARLELSDADRIRYAGQLSAILAYFHNLSEVDTSSVPPMSHPLDLENILREDEPGESLAAQVVLANAPDRNESCFRVPVILEQ
jgi:aspartyl-tRNA(Asn)/glutamyl-tRNA(Gln) amidotransferase subunit C